MSNLARIAPALTAAAFVTAVAFAPLLSSAQTTDSMTPPSDMGASSSSCSSVQGYPDQSTNRGVAESCYAASSSASLSASSDSLMSDDSSMMSSDSASSSWSASSSSSSL